MRMVKCECEHIFDQDKFVSCPHCANEQANVTVDFLGYEQGEVETAIPDHEKQNLYKNNFVKRNVVGWFVCTNGQMRGCSFEIKEGENRIGRNRNMDICLSGEDSVSRENHAVVIYENGEYLLKKEQVKQVLYQNGHSIETAQLRNRDQITVGNCELLFVALCDETFSWKTVV